MSGIADSVLTVISHYAARPDDCLQSLFARLSELAGNILVVVNSDEQENAQLRELKSASNGRFIGVLMVPNRGMNIGAWDAAYRAFPDFGYYVFLQDECLLLDPAYEARYKAALGTAGVGMVGETINPKWDFTWEVMRKSPLNYQFPDAISQKPIDRVSFYLACMEKWRIDPGPTARHLRALVWGFSRQCLRTIDGFPIGVTKEECIAAEIGVSRKVVSADYQLLQIGLKPFDCFGHVEWRSDGVAKIPV